MTDRSGSERSRVSRRRLLQAGSVGGALSMAGCSWLFGDAGSGTGQETATATPTPTPVDTVTMTGEETPTASADVDEERIEETLSDLSLDEKIGQMTQLEPKSEGSVMDPNEAGDAIGDLNVGSVLFGGANPPGDTAKEAAEYFNKIQSKAMNSVGVPLLLGIDAVHGNATVQEAAVFPHQIGLGATWSPDLARQVARATGRSITAMGVNWTFSPVADVAHDPRWGRYYESLNESPHVTGEFVRAMVNGYETVVDGDKQVAASVKHFAGYSMSDNGNDRNPADVSMRTMNDVVLPPYRAGIDAGAETVMANSGSINGVPAHASKYLQTKVLRDQWGFDGLVVSDWLDLHRMIGMHGYAGSIAEATEMAVNAGVDMYMAPHVWAINQYQNSLRSLVEEGAVSEERIDEAVRRILRVKDALGLFDDPTVPVERHYETVTDADRALAQTAAERSLTLLRNDSLLPLGSDVSSVLVTGPSADAPGRQLGGWTINWQGVGGGSTPPETVTVLDGLRERAPDGVDVSHVGTGSETLDNRSEVRRQAEQADVTVAVIGEGAYAEGRGDIDDLALPQGQRDLVATLDEAGADTVGVLIAGRPRGSESLFNALDASVMAYYPGSEGGTAVARLLFGEITPTGRLPFTWPTHTGQIPNTVADRTPPDGEGEGPSNGNRPLFPYGHGRHYRRVVHRSVTPAPRRVTSVAEDTRVAAKVTVENDGDGPTEEVVVLTADYDHEAEGSAAPVIPAQKQVVGFRRVSLDAGEKRTVPVQLSLASLAVSGGDLPGGGERVVPAGRYVVSDRAASGELIVEETAAL